MAMNKHNYLYSGARESFPITNCTTRNVRSCLYVIFAYKIYCDITTSAYIYLSKNESAQEAKLV